MLFIPTYLSFHALFRDADGCLCVKLETLACLPLFPDDVSAEQINNQKQLRHKILIKGEGLIIVNKM